MNEEKKIKVFFKSGFAISFFGKGISIEMVETSELRRFISNIYNLAKANLASNIAYSVDRISNGDDGIDYMIRVLNKIKWDIGTIQYELIRRVEGSNGPIYVTNHSKENEK